MWLIGTLSLLSLFAINNYGCPRMLVTNLNGDVKGKEAVMVDDMIDTARTIAKGADMLHREGEGAWKFMHTARMLFSVDMFYGSPLAIDRLSSGLFQEVITTNTIPVSEKNYLPPLTVLLVANLLGESIWRVNDDYPVSIVLHLYAFSRAVKIGT
ncbi:putative ribose-phosphate diphosphokinase [Helianthus annuus]|uniref:Ribose-phosphate diphosphokinase n=1 Tax=Helianthus annuus TaxID=4232 RepID=A0A251V4D1_HELAN|nr:putative ribose-phosphate diphosphokinase [Helianthus annuus]KAJ0496633.1 putative ribose-phosphate diphosphokinase [Helianthus annuus]